MEPVEQLLVGGPRAAPPRPISIGATATCMVSMRSVSRNCRTVATPPPIRTSLPSAASFACCNASSGVASTKRNVVSANVKLGRWWWVRTNTGVWNGGVSRHHPVQPRSSHGPRCGPNLLRPRPADARPASRRAPTDQDDESTRLASAVQPCLPWARRPLPAVPGSVAGPADAENLLRAVPTGRRSGTRSRRRCPSVSRIAARSWRGVRRPSADLTIPGGRSASPSRRWCRRRAGRAVPPRRFGGSRWSSAGWRCRRRHRRWRRRTAVRPSRPDTAPTAVGSGGRRRVRLRHRR